MTDRSSRRRLVRPVLALALVAVLAACGAVPGSPAPTTGDLPAPAAISIDQLLADIPSADGTSVAVNAFLLINDGSAQLCGIVLESYPPQCGGATIAVLGEVPANVLDSLDGTDDPTLAQARWGWVDVVGTVDAAGAAGGPTITIDSITISES
jgi:hypothetical protein